MVVKEKYDAVFEVFNADGDWLDVFIEYCPYDMFNVVRVIGGDEEGNLVDAIDRYDWKAELSVEEAIEEQQEPDL
jgi:hypothetical protein